MTSIDQNKFLLPAWGASLLLHGLAVLLAVMFAAQVRPDLKEDVFKWDVALVDAVKADSMPDPPTDHRQTSAEPVVRPVQPPARVPAVRPVEPPPDPVMHRVAPSQTVQVVHPEIRPPKPVEPREDSLPPVRTEQVISPVKPMQEKPVEPIEQKVVEAPQPKPESTVEPQKPEPVSHTEPVIAHRQPVTEVASAEMKEDRVAQQPVSEAAAIEPVRQANMQSSAQPAMPAEPTTVSPPKAGVSDTPFQVAKVAPVPEARADHRWVGESLWRRVAELKRYPTSARLNGQEGKVILKAVIRSDGQLSEVSVQKSSGHSILDTAAMEAVRLACPLHMKHAISKSEIVVSLPIVYSLAN
jgi:periplasmic protein TonB